MRPSPIFINKHKILFVMAWFSEGNNPVRQPLRRGEAAGLKAGTKRVLKPSYSLF
jgi:hypothetical protein